MTRPAMWINHRLLAELARWLHRQRIAGYPELVESGRLSAATAATQLRIMDAIATGWEAVAAFAPEPAGLYDPAQGGADEVERAETLVQLARRFRDAATAAPGDTEAEKLAQAVEALWWWERQPLDARWFADTNIALRARDAARAATPLTLFGEAA